jgi:hypothetical protein
MARAINWAQYDALKAQGLADREIARRWGKPGQHILYAGAELRRPSHD